MSGRNPSESGTRRSMKGSAAFTVVAPGSCRRGSSAE